MATATALTPTTVLVVAMSEMAARLHDNPAFADRFLTHMLTRNIRIEEALIDQLFNSSEKRLARALLLLARYGEHEKTPRTLPKVSQEVLAEMVGTTRSRVNFFMNKFRKLGFIEYNGGLKINKLAPERRAARLSPRRQRRVRALSTRLTGTRAASFDRLRTPRGSTRGAAGGRLSRATR